MREFILFVALALAWGSNWLVVKIGLESAPPFWLAAIRFFISFIALGSVILFKCPSYQSISGNWGKIMLVGSLSYGVSYGFIHWGQNYVSSGTASVLFASIPFFVAMFSYMMLRSERVTVLKVIGIVVGFAGIVVIYLGDISLHGEMAIWGAVVITLASATAGFTTVFVRKHLRHVDPLLLTHTQMIPGFILLLVMALVFDDVSALKLNANTILSTLHLALVGTAFAFWAFFYLLSRMNAVTLSLVGFVTPIVALFLGWLILDESITVRLGFGIALVLVGVWFASREPSGSIVSQKS
ncbi:MAG: EamA family transporter [Candidatus Zixiibacteriota bacterium]